MRKGIVRIACVLCAILCPLTARSETNLADISGADALSICHAQSGACLTNLGNSDEMLCVAGLWTVAPMLVISEAVDSGELKLSDSVTVSSDAAAVRGTTAFIESGEVISVEALFKSAAIIGAGDAVFALAEKLCGGSTSFVMRLNERLTELGLSVQYETLSEDTMLSAVQLSRIGAELSRSTSYLTYCGTYMDSITHENGKSTDLVNPNKFLRTLPGAKGLATGSSKDGGYCGIFLVSRGTSSFICTILGAKNNDLRFSTAKTAIEHAFATFESVTLISEGAVLVPDVAVNGSLGKTVALCAERDVIIAIPKGNPLPECVINAPESLNAPLSASSVCGTADYIDSAGNVLCSVNLVASASAASANFIDSLRLVAETWCGG